MLAQNRRLTLRLITEELGISKDTAHAIVPICAAQVHRRTGSKTDGHFWRLHFHVWPGSTASGKRRHGRWDLVLPVRPGIKTAIDGLVFTDFPATKKELTAKNQGRNTVDGLLRQQRHRPQWFFPCRSNHYTVDSLLRQQRHHPQWIFFLQVKPLMPYFTRQFWTDCYSVSGGFGQIYTRLENACCSTIMPLHTVRPVYANSWLRRW